MREVRLYTLSTCPWCRKAKSFFEEREVPFEFVDVDLLEGEEKEAVIDRVREISGSLQYPVAVIGESVVTGYNPKKYTTLLEQGGGKEATSEVTDAG